MVIQRRSLRAQIRDELLQRIKDGSIEAGAGINEAELASEGHDVVGVPGSLRDQLRGEQEPVVGVGVP